MAFRLIEVFLPTKDEYRIHQALEKYKILDMWLERFSKDLIHVKILVPTEKTEEVVDQIEKHISRVEGYRIILLPVEAILPRAEETKQEITEESKNQSEENSNKKTLRISREELYSEIDRTIKLSWIFIVLTLLSSVVAAIGILQNNVAVIIGAMVIAPLLGPNLALSLATTLGDIDLARRATKANIAGIVAALSFAAMVGYLFKVDPDIPEILSRTKVSLGDILLALAAGSAAALSLTSGVSSALIGVMVAVALLPPLVVLGMLIGSGHWALSFGALLLVLTNLICINLAGVMTFLVQGIRPRKYWDADRARKASHIAIVIWTLLLILLVVLIILSKSA